MAKWLVVGGAGFIGSHIAEFLVARGEKVRILDNFYTGKKEHLQNIQSKIELIKGDIRNPKIVDAAFKGMDYCLHQAAFRSVPKSLEEPLLCNSINTEGLLVCLMAAVKHKIKRFVFASSSSVYGMSTDFPQKETTFALTLSPYAATKAIGEHYLHIFAQAHGLNVTALRYFNVFGPRQDPKSKYAAVIPKFIISALKRKPIEIHWDGKQSRDFSYVEDVVTANYLAAQSKKPGMQTYNVACGQTHSLLDIAKIIEKIVGYKLDRKFFPRRAGDIRKTFADIALIEKDLKFKPKMSFERAVQETFNYFKEDDRWKQY